MSLPAPFRRRREHDFSESAHANAEFATIRQKANAN
jgi:hypothetical protein